MGHSGSCHTSGLLSAVLFGRPARVRGGCFTFSGKVLPHLVFQMSALHVPLGQVDCPVELLFRYCGEHQGAPQVKSIASPWTLQLHGLLQLLDDDGAGVAVAGGQIFRQSRSVPIELQLSIKQSINQSYFYTAVQTSNKRVCCSVFQKRLPHQLRRKPVPSSSGATVPPI